VTPPGRRYATGPLAELYESDRASFGHLPNLLSTAVAQQAVLLPTSQQEDVAVPSAERTVVVILL
jgi:hypothetical protein